MGGVVKCNVIYYPITIHDKENYNYLPNHFLFDTQIETHLDVPTHSL